jgi:SAM-dependent methyltransferase
MTKTKDDKKFWDEAKARWYRRGIESSGMAGAVLPVIERAAPEAESYLDVGSGCGALALPIARAGGRVTALDPSAEMLGILKEEALKEGLENISTVNAAWGEADIETHDVVICANVPDLMKGSAEFAKAADGIANKAVCLIENADPASDKFYYKDLFPLILGKPFKGRADYLATYAALHSEGIFANVEIIDYNFDQPFDDLDEAVSFWTEYMGIADESKPDNKIIAALRGYLDGKLTKKDGGLLAKFSKKSAVMWWRK